MSPTVFAPCCSSGRVAAVASSSSSRSSPLTRLPVPSRSCLPLATPARPHHLPPPRAQLGEPSKRPSNSPSQPSPGAPPPGSSDGKSEDESADAAAAATNYAEGVARVAEEGISEAGDVVYAAQADAIAAERKAAEGEALSEDDIRRLAALRRSGATSSGAASPADSGSLVQGVLEEARLIEWPTFGRAAGDTAVVLAIVAASAAVLFAINTALTEVSALIY